MSTANWAHQNSNISPGNNGQKARKSISKCHHKSSKFKKTSITQQARMNAIAAKSLKKKNDLRNAIISSIRNAIKFLHRTGHDKKTSFHQMPVCICCDNFIIGTERVHRMKKETLKKYEPCLGVTSYEHFHNERLHPLLIKQYRVKGLRGMLLSPRANKNKDGYSMCSSCYTTLRRNSQSDTKPPKFSIANGFVIGSFPKVIPVATGKLKGTRRVVNVEDETDISEVMRTLSQCKRHRVHGMRSDRQQLTHKGTITPITSSFMQKKKKKQKRNKKISTADQKRETEQNFPSRNGHHPNNS